MILIFCYILYHYAVKLLKLHFMCHLIFFFFVYGTGGGVVGVGSAPNVPMRFQKWTKQNKTERSLRPICCCLSLALYSCNESRFYTSIKKKIIRTEMQFKLFKDYILCRQQTTNSTKIISFSLILSFFLSPLCKQLLTMLKNYFRAFHSICVVCNTAHTHTHILDVFLAKS